MVKKLADATKSAAEGLRERKKTRTRDAIVEAALDLFERHGYEATTVEEIAEAADISPRTFFRYFDSKLEVAMPAVAREEHEHDSASREMLAALVAEKGPVTAIHEMMRQEMEAKIAEDPLMLRQFRVMMTTPSLKARAFDHFQENQGQFRQLFAAELGIDDDHLQAHLRAAAVGTALWTVIDRWAAEGGKPNRLLPMVDEAFDLLAQGMSQTSAR